MNEDWRERMVIATTSTRGDGLEESESWKSLRMGEARELCDCEASNDNCAEQSENAPCNLARRVRGSGAASKRANKETLE